MTADPKNPANADPGKPARKPRVALKDEPYSMIQTSPIDHGALPPPSFAAPRPARIRREGGTEDLLNGMIAEMHYIIREIAVTSACETADPQTRVHFIDSAAKLAVTGANLAQTIAKLRVADTITQEQGRDIVDAVARSVAG